VGCRKIRKIGGSNCKYNNNNNAIDNDICDITICDNYDDNNDDNKMEMIMIQVTMTKMMIIRTILHNNPNNNANHTHDIKIIIIV